eukprot:7145566-Pyramimonas_sp.AAC.1
MSRRWGGARASRGRGGVCPKVFAPLRWGPNEEYIMQGGRGARAVAKRLGASSIRLPHGALSIQRGLCMCFPCLSCAA